MVFKRYNIKITEKATGVINDCDLTVPSLEVAMEILQNLFDSEDFIIGKVLEIPIIVQIVIDPYCPN
jgi:hypothetical protein